MQKPSDRAPDPAAYEQAIRSTINWIKLGRAKEAADNCVSAASLDASRCESYLLLGVVAYMLDDIGRAIELLNSAHGIDPDCRECCDILAQLHLKGGNLSDSVYFAKLGAVGAANPLLEGLVVEGLGGVGETFARAEKRSYAVDAMRAHHEKRWHDAVLACEKEVRLTKGDAALFRIYGEALAEIGEYDRGVAALLVAIHQDSRNPWNFLELGRIYCHGGERELAQACFRNALRQAPADAAVLAFASHEKQFFPAPWPELDEATAAFAKEVRSAERGRRVSPVGETIKIGYVTDSACSCDELRIVEALLWHHDRQRFEVSVFSMDAAADPMVDRMKDVAARWTNIADVDDESVARTIAAANLDILVDLTFSARGHRPGIMVRRPAGKVLKWGGSDAGVLGLGFDGRLCPAGMDVPGGIPVVSYEGPMVGLDAKAIPRLVDSANESGHQQVNFGTMCELARITPEMAMVWSRILRRVDGARLMFFGREPVSDTQKSRLQALFATFGVVDRIGFIDPPGGEMLLDIAPHELSFSMVATACGLASLKDIDVYLEPYPAGGFLDVADALWAGLPVVAMAGQYAAAFIAAAGVGDEGADDAESYVAKAVAAAEKVASNPDLRVELHAKVRNSPLFDVKAWVGALERAYLDVLGAA